MANTPATASEPEAPPAPPSPPGPLAPAHRRLATVRASFENEAAPDVGGAARTEAGCRTLTGDKHKPFSRCSFTPLANGTAFDVAFVYDCGEHQCDYDEFVWYGDKQGPELIPGHSGDELEVSPDHRYLIRSELLWSDTLPGQLIGGQVTRIERATKKKELFAPCFSATLSPRNYWFVCRDAQGNVLKFPIDGGPTELVARAAIPDGDELKLGGPFGDYPAKVTFPSATELHYELYVVSEQVLEFTVPWRE